MTRCVALSLTAGFGCAHAVAAAPPPAGAQPAVETHPAAETQPAAGAQTAVETQPASEAAPAAGDVQPPSELKKLSLEELFDLEVTSVSRRPEKLSETAAAIHVVTQEDIRREGALSLPEALRDVPGVEVARVDARQYAITSRGFNGTAANKLLVMIDGRSVYTPLFSGVFWDAQDTFMEDVDRIEIIRGPGATQWGANAVNGVINVITKTAEQTQRLLVTAGDGGEERLFAGARYGGRLGDDAAFRVYAKAFDRDESILAGGEGAGDRFRMGQGGFRVDWNASTRDRLTVQGDLYDGSAGQPAAPDIELEGGNVLGRWIREVSEGSSLQLQVYYDRTEREIPPIFGEDLGTYDLDFQNRLRLGARQTIVWGLGYRLTRDRVANGLVLAFLPSRQTHRLYTGFLQDEIALIAERLHLAIGSKFEHNDYTGFEYQPSLRLAWTTAKGHLLWSALSRVVRTPSRIDRELFAPGQPPFILAGGPEFESEVLHACELGYKMQPVPSWSGSLALFQNDYDKLRSLEGGSPYVIANGLEGTVRGAELETSYQPLVRWRLEGGATLLSLQLRARTGSTDTMSVDQEGDSPRQQFFVKSWVDLPGSMEWDVTVRRVGELERQQVPAYTAWDVRWSWNPTPGLELALFGRNLFDRRHREFGMPATGREIERSLYAKATWRF